MASSSVLKKPQPARYGVENSLKYAGPRSGKLRVHSAFSAVFALSRTRLKLFQHAASHSGYWPATCSSMKSTAAFTSESDSETLPPLGGINPVEPV